MKFVPCMTFSMLLFSMNVNAEGGCPPGQLPAQSNGSMASCVPIPQDNPEPQRPRPTGKWLKTWGALADDGAGDVGVSTGKLNKEDAEKAAIENCEKGIEKKCHTITTYINQCIAVAEPNRTGNINLGIESGPSLEKISRAAIVDCQKYNEGIDCKISYTNCTEPVFQKF
ncbi:DUF4189 domain-containing protein [Xanthomonas albilineans]|uniref:DUF4189 domain-containing protein n=1 Tax=Xanthomonas albilineans TaxID=29447 RepID=UPI0009B95631|nr:DUF4189 domain-containing protein [Xanthomonas albilineans]